MAEEKAQDQSTAKPQPSASMIGNYVKDLSFENIAVQSGYVIKQQPQFEMNLNVNNKKLDENFYEVSLNIKVKAVEGDQTVFILDLDHAGRFRLNNVDQNSLVPFLYIECPRILFPFTRRVVADVTMDGGLLPLNLEPIDFVQMFQNSVRAAQEKQAADKN